MIQLQYLKNNRQPEKEKHGAVKQTPTVPQVSFFTLYLEKTTLNNNRILINQIISN